MQMKNIAKTSLTGLNLPGKVTSTSWQLPTRMSEDQWIACGLGLNKIDGAVQWWLGDWWAYGEHTYGSRKALFAEGEPLENMNFQTVREYGTVARAVKSEERSSLLTFAHHHNVAPLPPAQQRKWLARAARGKWSATKLCSELKLWKRQQRQIAPPDLPALTDRCELIHASVRDLVHHVEPSSIDWIITDPPYPRQHLSCFRDLSETAARLLRPGASCLIMSGQSFLPEVMQLLGEHLRYHWTAAYLTPGGQSVQLWERHVNTFWKPLLWYTNGDYDGDWVGDVCRSDPNDNDKRHHNWGQSESGMADIVQRFTRAGDIILDPFLGGATTGVAS